MTNATVEGLNRIIKTTKNWASGPRSLKAFADIIYLTVGDLDTPARIPVKFRVILIWLKVNNTAVL